jgi:CRP-like cAMP-binding protein
MPSGPGNLVISHAMQEQFLLRATSISKPRGSVLFRRGDAVIGLFLIRSGRVSLVLEDARAAFPPRILGAGSVVGLPATVAGSPYSLTAEVIDDAELAFVPRPAVNDCLKQNPQLCFEGMDMLSGEISGTRRAIKRGSTLRAHRE